MQETVTPAYLSQQAVSVLSAAVELRGTQTTVMSNYTLLVPPTVNLRADSEVIDEDGNLYQINGAVAERRGLRKTPLFLAASVQLISDLVAS